MTEIDLAAFEEAAGVSVERSGPSDLADVLERVLDTGIVVAGEIRIDLLDIELLTIRLRLVITSIDKAEEVGLDWWRGDRWYSTPAVSGRDRAELDEAHEAVPAESGGTE